MYCIHVVLYLAGFSEIQTVHGNKIIHGVGLEDNAVIQGLIEARLSHAGAPSDLLAGVFN